jgi:hypothetical protein
MCIFFCRVRAPRLRVPQRQSERETVWVAVEGILESGETRKWDRESNVDKCAKCGYVRLPLFRLAPREPQL